MNVEVEATGAGDATVRDEGPASIPTDPATVIPFIVRDIAAGPGLIGQWGPAADPEALGRAILAYEQGLEQQLVPVDYSATGGDPLARLDAAREIAIQNLYPTCREGDAELLRKVAAIANRAGLGTFNEDGYGILYRDEIPGAPEPEPEPNPDDASTSDTEDTDNA
jgi:hypothetical protein